VTPIIRAVAVLLASTAALLLHPGTAASQTVEMCYDQAVPAGYVVTAISQRPDCPAYYSRTYNSITVAVPGETVTVCSSLSTLGQGYVMTARGQSPACPGYYTSTSNTITYQRVGGAPAPEPAAPTAGLALLDQYQRSVGTRMMDMEEWLGLRTPTHQPWFSSANQDATQTTTLQVTGGARYTVLAVCDDDCTDLNLRVLDRGYVVAQDIQPEAYARLELAPANDATFTLEARMAACDSAPCRYSVAVYETPSAAMAPAGRPPRRERMTPSPARPTPRP
jgi:hypothetical protein